MNTNRVFNIAKLVVILASLVAAAVGTSSASTHVWSGAGGDGLFSNSANWSSGGAPAPGATVILRFPPAGTTQAVVNVANLVAQEISITRTQFTLAGVGDATPL